MQTLSQKIALRSVKTLNVLLMLLPFAVYCRRCVSETDSSILGVSLGIVMTVFVCLYLTYGKIYDSFSISRSKPSALIYSQALALFMTDALTYVVLCLMAQRLVMPLKFVIMLSVQLFLAVCWVLYSHKWYFKRHPPRRAAIVYDRQRNVETMIRAYGMEKKYRIERVMTVDECMAEDLEMLADMETVFLCGIHSHERNILLKHCVNHRITVYVLPRIGDVIMSNAKPIHLFHLPFLRVARYDPPLEYLMLKRLLDVVISAAALVVLCPILLATAASIKLYDGGPVLYRQTRLTKDGKKFDVLKFRSMRQDAEANGVAVLSSGEHDDRITPVGHVIRRYRIDELPQLINILQGSMSLVGPRPERPEIASQYEQQLPEFSLRLQAKAGLTGYAQVYGKYNTTPYDKLQMDLMYIGNPSLLEDIRIIFATVKVLFMSESTEGISEGMSTAMEEIPE